MVLCKKKYNTSSCTGHPARLLRASVHLHVGLNPEAPPGSWRAMWCCWVLRILEADPLSKDLCVVQIIHGKSEWVLEPQSILIKDSLSQCLLMGWEKKLVSHGACSRPSSHCFYIFREDRKLFLNWTLRWKTLWQALLFHLAVPFWWKNCHPLWPKS